MGFFDEAKNFLGDNWKGLADVGLGGYDVYQSVQAGKTANELAGQSADIQKDQWNWWMDKKAPLEEARIARELWEMDQTDDLFKKGVEARGKGIDLYNTSIDSSLKDFEQYERNRGLEQEFYDRIGEGVDRDAAMGRAETDVKAAHKDAVGKMARDLGRYGVGINPSGGRFVNSIKNIGLQQAKEVAAARTNAYNDAGDRELQQLASGVDARQRLAPASQGLSSMYASQKASTTAPNSGQGLANLAEVAGQNASTTSGLATIQSGLKKIKKG